MTQDPIPPSQDHDAGKRLTVLAVNEAFHLREPLPAGPPVRPPPPPWQCPVALAAYSPVSSSDTCRPNELLIRAKAQIEAAFFPSSTCDSWEVVKSVRSES